MVEKSFKLNYLFAPSNPYCARSKMTSPKFAPNSTLQHNHVYLDNPFNLFVISPPARSCDVLCECPQFELFFRLLHQSALWDNAELLEDLLNGDELDCLNARDSWGRTALHAAATNENSQCLRILTQAGAGMLEV